MIVAAGCGKQTALKATIKLHCIGVKEKEAFGDQRFRVSGSKVQSSEINSIRENE